MWGGVYGSLIFGSWVYGSFPLKIKMLLIIVQSSSRSRIFILTVYSCPESCCRQGLPFVGNVLFEIVVSSKVLLKFLTRRRKLSIRTVELSKSSLVITSLFTPLATFATHEQSLRIKGLLKLNPLKSAKGSSQRPYASEIVYMKAIHSIQHR